MNRHRLTPPALVNVLTGVTLVRVDHLSSRSRIAITTAHVLRPRARPYFPFVPRAIIRRPLTVSVYLLAWAVVLALTPILILPLAVRDIVRGRNWAMVRALLMLNLYLGCEAVGIVASFVFWLGQRRSRERYRAQNLWLQSWWARTQFVWGTRIYAIRTVIEGEEALAPGPLHLFIRHVSVIDNLIPAVTAENRGLELRWVLNQSLLKDPCIDIVGQRLRNVFVRGGAQDSEADIARVRGLAAGMGPEDGTCIYPEGTLFSPEKRLRVIAKLRATADPELVARAEAMPNVLPLRLGGALALIEGAPEADLVFCAHTGLEKATRRADIALGSFTGTTLRVRFWRISAASVPADREGRVRLLLDEWAKVDAFVGAGSV